jgi:hypothetical protein
MALNPTRVGRRGMRINMSLRPDTEPKPTPESPSPNSGSSNDSQPRSLDDIAAEIAVAREVAQELEDDLWEELDNYFSQTVCVYYIQDLTSNLIHTKS